MKLSILMPVYNEEARVADAVKQALDVAYPCETELVVVDDGSRDATAEILRAVDDARINVVVHSRNQGKGAANDPLRTDVCLHYCVLLPKANDRATMPNKGTRYYRCRAPALIRVKDFPRCHAEAKRAWLDLGQSLRRLGRV